MGVSPNQRSRININLRIYGIEDACTKACDVIGKNIYLLNADTPSNVLEGLGLLDARDRNDALFRMTVFAIKVPLILGWEEDDTVVAEVDSLKLYGSSPQGVYCSTRRHLKRASDERVIPPPEHATVQLETTPNGEIDIPGPVKGQAQDMEHSSFHLALVRQTQ
ncbi:Aste57867_10171 [Aphanomyces stellatus]|uniref:Aste57867_10171 protein n=1 Tax=Aphanomyces stellatus TaxID=120398 RepID=A0A485KQ76_9STRA|nr:hypothetical protein As57867_010132 [Aphanomyces stellatus]VFT87047.1 Aste57867_10171 [Aphanomyces stellatus]